MTSEHDIIPLQRKRFFLLTPGRSGSGFLSTILAESGANFVTGKGSEEFPRTSIYENEELNKAGFLLEQAYSIQSRHEYDVFYKIHYKKIVTLKRFIAKRKLNKFLENYTYCKNTSHLHHGLRISANLGYWPVVILDYRNYQTWMGSLYPGQRYRTVESLTQAYVLPVRNALCLLGLFGGCAVSYEEIMDLEATEWAHVLGRTTGLDPRDILANRARIYSPPGPETALPVRDVVAEQLEAMAREYQGKVVPPSLVALQYWGPNPTKGPLPKRRFLGL